ncbi:aminoglycoside phosphotransferase family protein [Sinorhizobium arboris]|uniref:aminoglycoside phosphotransferase family protein n=1 Tax=Sinorhizobium arboris TaxID=76745 RepID=UPI000418B12F|nr:aminoglycoside phosphotransferase family protein [Sinorhizobium arboris]
MTLTTQIQDAARKALLNVAGPVAAEAVLTHRRLSLGSEASEVVRVSARFAGRRGKPQTITFVVKHLQGRTRREATIYRDLVATHASAIAPRLLDVQDGQAASFLVVEAINQAMAWPWQYLDLTAVLLRQLGQFHVETMQSMLPLTDWDYEGELAVSAAETLARLEHFRYYEDLRPLARHARMLDRVVSNLARLRGALLDESTFNQRPIHGDLHPGNAMVRRGIDRRPVMIDWGRTRPGSPLEDVSSMLQSLRFFEPSALQRHDLLLKEYLTGLGRDRRIDDATRGAYWVAGASNALAGALNVHLLTVMDASRNPRQRRRAFLVARDWLRVIRRAHAWAF